MKTFKQFQEGFEHEETPAFKAFDDWSFKNHNPHLGNDHNDVEGHLKQKTPFTHEETGHIKRYTNSSYELNKALYTAHMDGGSTPTHVQSDEDDSFHDTHALHRAVHKPLEHDLHVHAGVSFHPGHYAEEFGHVHLPAFTSTSLSAGVAHSFSRKLGPDRDERHVLHIHMKPGDHAAYIGHVSNMRGEKEVLIPRHTTLHVDHENPTIHTDSAGAKVHVWHAKIAHQEAPSQ